MPARVLVVDDDRAIRRTLEKLLAGEGPEVTTAGDGRQARDAAGGADLVLLAAAALAAAGSRRDLALPGPRAEEIRAAKAEARAARAVLGERALNNGRVGKPAAVPDAPHPALPLGLRMDVHLDAAPAHEVATR